jgi:C4-dicarboxylate-binding protein DctP
MKKIMTVVLSVSLILAMMLSFASCGSGKTSSAEYTAENPLLIKISHPDSESNVHQESFEEFKAYVEEQTEGKVKVEIYANGILGGDQEVMQMVATNEVQMAEAGTSVFACIGDKFCILDLPFLFSSWETMNEAVTGELGELYNSFLEESGYYGLAFMWDGSKTISNNKRPINTLEDMKGLKIRITDADMYKQTLDCLGANPTPMSWGDIYSGLQQGTVDGMDVPALSTYSNGWHEAIKYWSLTNHHMSNVVVYTSKSFMDNLPDDIAAVVREGATLYLQDADRTRAKAAEEEAIEAMKKDGVKVNEVKDLEPFREAVQPVYDTYREKLGDEIMDKVESFRK